MGQYIHKHKSIRKTNFQTTKENQLNNCFLIIQNIDSLCYYKNNSIRETIGVDNTAKLIEMISKNVHIQIQLDSFINFLQTI